MAKKKESEIDNGDLVGEEASKFLDEIASDTTEQAVYDREIGTIKFVNGIAEPEVLVFRKITIESINARPVYKITHETESGTNEQTNQSPAAVMGYLRKALYNGLK